MQKTAGILYTVGKVLNIIEIVFMVLFTLVSFYGIANAQTIFDQMQNLENRIKEYERNEN